MSRLYWIWIVTVFAEIIYLALLVVSITLPERRIWPPPARKSWQFRLVWTLIVLAYGGLHLLALLDWNTFIFPAWLRFGVGVPLLVAGAGFALWGVAALSWHLSLGLKGELITGGPYRYSRNPQYVGDTALCLAIVLISNAALAVVPGLLGALLFVVTPFSEEPWLEGRFGAAYKNYCKKTPRFLGDFGLRREVSSGA